MVCLFLGIPLLWSLGSGSLHVGLLSALQCPAAALRCLIAVASLVEGRRL